MQKMRRLLAPVLLLCIVSCGSGIEAPLAEETPEGGAKPVPAKLTLYCGAGIRPAAEALIAAFASEHGGEIRATYAGSEMLLGQISAGSGGDLFMPGAESYVDRAIELGLAEGDTKRIAAYFVPVIFVAKGNPRNIQSLDDLKRDGLRVGLGDERSCAVGRQTLRVLEKNGMACADLEANVRFKSATVNELPMQIQLGNLDAVICWDANARQFGDNGDMVPIAPARNVPSTVPIVRLTSSVSPDTALAFVEFVASDKGRKILEAANYTVDLRQEPAQEESRQ